MDPQAFGSPLEVRPDEFSKSGVQDDLKVFYEKPHSRKHKGIDSKGYVEEMSRMLKESDAKLLINAKQLELYKRSIENLQQQNGELINEKQQVVRQLQSLFTLYNKQKKTIEQLKDGKTDIETERKTFKDRVMALERENERLKLDRSRELELVTTRHKNIVEEMERRTADLEKKLALVDDEKHQLRMTETDLKEQLRTKDKKLMEAQYSLDSTKSKMDHEISLLTKQKEQATQDNKTLEKKLSSFEREEERRSDEERKVRKELARLTYANEELSDQIQRFKEKSLQTEVAVHTKHKKRGETSETPSMQRLTEIERKLETILSYQKSGSKSSKVQKDEPQSVNGTDQEEQRQSIEQQPEEVPEENEENEEESNPEDMLKNLTVQILEKDELQNMNIIKMFKLDLIQLDDKANEYKNLLKAMGALYFANRYGKMTGPLFNVWKARLQEKLKGSEVAVQEDENGNDNGNDNEDENEEENGLEPEPEGEPEVEVDVKDNREPEIDENHNDEEEQDQNLEQHIREDTESEPGHPNGLLDEGVHEAKEGEGSAEGLGSVHENSNSGHHLSKPCIEIDPDLANREAIVEPLTDEIRGKEGGDTDPEVYSKGDEIRVDDRPEGWNGQEDEQQSEGSQEDNEELARQDLLEGLGQKLKGRAKSDRDEYSGEQVAEDDIDAY